MIKVQCKWFGDRHSWADAKELEFISYISESTHVEIVYDESIADIIIVFNKHLTPVRRFDFRLLTSNYYRANRKKILVYDETDLPTYILPGLYVSTHSRQIGKHVLPVPYINLGLCAFAEYNNHVRPITCSFWGRESHDIRTQLYAINRQGFSIKNTSKHDYFNMEPDNQNRLLQQKREYSDVLGRSMYSICPRGFGTSSIRLFESILAGCVPVIISDNYVPTYNVDWDKCALFIKESQISQTVGLIEEDKVNYVDRKFMVENVVNHTLQPSSVTDYICHNRPHSSFQETFLRFFSYTSGRKPRSKVTKH